MEVQIVFDTLEGGATILELSCHLHSLMHGPNITMKQKAESSTQRTRSSVSAKIFRAATTAEKRTFFCTSVIKRFCALVHHGSMFNNKNKKICGFLRCNVIDICATEISLGYNILNYETDMGHLAPPPSRSMASIPLMLHFGFFFTPLLMTHFPCQQQGGG